jgi:hypothetical protein
MEMKELKKMNVAAADHQVEVEDHEVRRPHLLVPTRGGPQAPTRGGPRQHALVSQVPGHPKADQLEWAIHSRGPRPPRQQRQERDGESQPCWSFLSFFPRQGCDFFFLKYTCILGCPSFSTVRKEENH